MCLSPRTICDAAEGATVQKRGWRRRVFFYSNPVKTRVKIKEKIFLMEGIEAEIQDREIMKNSACQNEEVPDGMAEAQRAPAVEDHAQTVCQTAQQQEHHRSSGHFFQTLPEDDHPCPAHRQVEPHGWFLKTGFKADLQDQAY